MGTTTTTTPANLLPHIGQDGMATDSPLIAYTEKVLEQKELELKKYIQDNYSKIRNVERELTSLALEVKLTAGPKKAALEHLRKKIELSAEKIKVARQKEEQARKVWEAATKVLKEEEEKKQILCEDLNRLVQESAASQYSRLEELKQRLEALNPELRGGTVQPSSLETGSETSVSLHKAENSSQQTLPGKVNGGLEGTLSTLEKSNEVSLDGYPAKASGPRHDGETQRFLSGPSVPGGNKISSSTQSNGQGETRSHNSPAQPGNLTRGRGRLVKGALAAQRPKANTWTGAGFDVDDNAVNG